MNFGGNANSSQWSDISWDLFFFLNDKIVYIIVLFLSLTDIIEVSVLNVNLDVL